MKTEARIQQEIVMWFRNNVQRVGAGVIFSVPNESKSVKEVMKKKATGLLEGASDLVILLPDGKVLLVETKDEKGRQSDSQKRFEKMCESLGHTYVVVRSLEDVKEMLKKV